MGYKVAAFNAMESVPTLPSHQTLRHACTDLAIEAAREIMRIYAGDLGVRDKADNSPVTDADHAAEAIIVAGLRRLTPDTTVVAEEEMAAGRVAVIGDGPFWLVDPLDGTKEFIKRNGEFTVNIALIEGGKPTLGIVLAPVPDTLWRGTSGLGADKSDKGGAFLDLYACALGPAPVRHLGDEVPAAVERRPIVRQGRAAGQPGRGPDNGQGLLVPAVQRHAPLALHAELRLLPNYLAE